MESTYSRWRLCADTLVISAAAIALHVALARQSGIISDGGLRDTDAFMRLIRVQELWQTGVWYQHITSTLGAPEGLSLHWTRPLDILILLPAMLLHLGGMGIERAIYWSGVAVSPVLQVAASLAAAFYAKQIWEKHGAWRVAALMVLFNGAAISYCMIGRPDHHSLGLFLTVVAAGQAIRAVLNPNDAGSSYRAGAWAAAGVWVSPEALVGVAPSLIAFGVLWLTARSADAPTPPGLEWVRIGRRFSLGMAATILIAIPIEQAPSNWLVPEYDKISVLHLLIALTAALDFKLAEMMPWTGWRRFIAAAAVASLSGLFLTWLFPHFYLGPLGNVTDQTAKIFLDDVKEMSPLWPVNRASTDMFFGIIGNSLAALPVIPYCLWRWRGKPAFPVAVLLSLSYLTALLGALLHQRLAVPLAPYGALLGCGLFAMLCDLAVNMRRLTQTLMRVAACIIVVFVGQLWLLAGSASNATPITKDACEPKPVADWLNANRPGIVTVEPMGAERHTPIIFTESINYTPDLAYRTPYRFVGGPYHRGFGDIADMFNASTGTDDATVHGIITRRQAAFVLVCITEVPKVIGESAPNSLYHLLLRGEPPAWLQPVPMGPEASHEFRLFAVKR